VLFVDDEPCVLEALGRALHPARAVWEMRFAEGGAAALEHLAQAPIDVIVTDMRMPGMDGPELLRQVRAKFPDVVRIVLSAQTDEGENLRAIGVAHQFLAKPCPVAVLRQVVDRASAVRSLLRGPIRRAIGQIDRLPSVPRLYTELNRALSDERTSADMLASIVKQDPAISARLLQIASSAVYARGGKVSDVRTAVVRLGGDMLRNLILSAAVFEQARSSLRATGLDIEKLQEHALRVAALTEAIAPRRQLGFGTGNGEAFTAGLLADVGILALAVSAPERLRELNATAKAQNVLFHEVERMREGPGHGEVGGYLLGVWGLSDVIVEAVANHHAPKRNIGRDFGVAAAVHVASSLIDGAPPDAGYVAELPKAEIERVRQVLSARRGGGGGTPAAAAK
jgi:HD-like signal output (HDOD) protein